MIAKYDVNGNGLSRLEVAFMSKTGKLAVALARELQTTAPPDVAQTPVGGGESWWEVRERVTVAARETITSAKSLDPVLAEQLIAACHQSTYTHVQTLDDAFAAVDQGEFAVTRFSDPATGKQYLGIDYGAGDSTYGAIFEAGSTRPAFGIEDGRAGRCRPTPGLRRARAGGRCASACPVTSRLTVTGPEGLDARPGRAAHRRLPPVDLHPREDAGGRLRCRRPERVRPHHLLRSRDRQAVPGHRLRRGRQHLRRHLRGGPAPRPPSASRTASSSIRRAVAVSAGESWWEVRERVPVASRETLTSASDLDPVLAQQLIAACHQSTYTHVKTIEDAFAAVDQGEFALTRFSIRPPASSTWASTTARATAPTAPSSSPAAPSPPSASRTASSWPEVRG